MLPFFSPSVWSQDERFSPLDVLDVNPVCCTVLILMVQGTGVSFFSFLLYFCVCVCWPESDGDFW